MHTQPWEQLACMHNYGIQVTKLKVCKKMFIVVFYKLIGIAMKKHDIQYVHVLAVVYLEEL